MCRTPLASCLVLVSCLGTFACSSSDSAWSDDDVGSGSTTTSVGTGATGTTATGTGTTSGTSTSAAAAPTGAGGSPDVGLLTAADWDDNLNFELFQDFRAHALANDPGKATLDSGDRIVIKVVDEQGQPIPNAGVSVHQGGTTYLDAPTASDGRVLFFPTHDGAGQAPGLTVTVSPPQAQPSVGVATVLAPQGSEWTFTLAGAQPILPPALDLAFVIDATGSMGDEIEYLKAEVKGIVDNVYAEVGQVSLHLGLVVYRDVGDLYVTQTFDFTDSIATFQAALAAQSADAGGDLPEAMDQAVEAMNELSWRSGNVARIAFVVADAPPHAENGAAMLAGADAARHMGVKIYPIAASGADAEAEYYLRLAAEATLGRYLFLTDDSGIGGDHVEPHLPCYQVQHLNVLINRMIASEMTGTRVPADPSEVLRTVGDPVDNVCTLADGTTASF